MRIAAVADLHGFLPEIPDADVCIIAGDVVIADGSVTDSLITFGAWLSALIERKIVPIGVAGNHDFWCQGRSPWETTHITPQELPWIYLEDSGINYGGLNFYGSPWQAWYGGWAFNAPEVDPGEGFLDEKFRQIPDDTDVLITHSPPAGFFDRIGNRNVGSLSLNKHVQRVMPTLHVFGHIHQQGVEQVEGVTLCNAAVTTVRDRKYHHSKQPICFDV